jgi:hypothetical protein
MGGTLGVLVALGMGEGVEEGKMAGVGLGVVLELLKFCEINSLSSPPHAAKMIADTEKSRNRNM